eukprot:gene19757-26450_t
MAGIPCLPAEVVADIVRRSLLLESTFDNVSSACRSWHALVSRYLADALIHRQHGDMAAVLERALEHGKLDVACGLVSNPQSVGNSHQALSKQAFNSSLSCVGVLRT